MPLLVRFAYHRHSGHGIAGNEQHEDVGKLGAVVRVLVAAGGDQAPDLVCSGTVSRHVTAHLVFGHHCALRPGVAN